MAPRLAPLDLPPRVVADGGASVVEPPQSEAAVVLARRLGADAVTLRVHRTADGVLVAAQEPKIGGFLRRRAIADLTRAELGDDVLAFDAALARDDLELWLRADGDEVLAAVLAAADGAEDRLVIVDESLDRLRDWRPRTSARLARVGSGAGSAEMQLAELTEAEVDYWWLPARDWKIGMVAAAHRFGRRTVAADVEHEREAVAAYGLGHDAVVGPHPDRLVSGRRAVHGDV